jgi:hypothetical protein
MCIEHLLWGCHKVSDVWHELNRWIFEMTYIEIPLNLEIVMFGLLLFFVCFVQWKWIFFHSISYFQQTYNLRPMFLQFYGITLTVKKWLHYTGVNVHEKNPQPLMPFNIGLFLKSRNLQVQWNFNICHFKNPSVQFMP